MSTRDRNSVCEFYHFWLARVCICVCVYVREWVCEFVRECVCVCVYEFVRLDRWRINDVSSIGWHEAELQGVPVYDCDVWRSGWKHFFLFLLCLSSSTICLIFFCLWTHKLQQSAQIQKVSFFCKDLSFFLHWTFAGLDFTFNPNFILSWLGYDTFSRKRKLILIGKV